MFPFSKSNHIGKALFSIKIKEIIKKLKIKYRVGVGMGFIAPIRWHPFNNLNKNYYLYSIHYYCILFYNVLQY